MADTGRRRATFANLTVTTDGDAPGGSIRQLPPLGAIGEAPSPGPQAQASPGPVAPAPTAPHGAKGPKRSLSLPGGTPPPAAGPRKQTTAAGATVAGGVLGENKHVSSGVPAPAGTSIRYYSKAEVLRLREIFDTCDMDGSGTVSTRELMEFMATGMRRVDRPDIAPQENGEVAEGRINKAAIKGVNRTTIYVPQSSSIKEKLIAERAAARGTTLSSVSVSMSDQQGRSKQDVDHMAAQAVGMMDKDKSGTVDFTEYLVMHYPRSTLFERQTIAAWSVWELDERRKASQPRPLREQLTADQVDDIRGIFSVFNLSGDGQMSRTELTHALLDAGQDLGTVDELFKLHAKGKDHLNQDDWIDAMAESYLYRFETSAHRSIMAIVRGKKG